MASAIADPRASRKARCKSGAESSEETFQQSSLNRDPTSDAMMLLTRGSEIYGDNTYNKKGKVGVVNKVIESTGNRVFYLVYINGNSWDSGYFDGADLVVADQV